MTEKDKRIENEKLEKVTGGKSYWDGPSIRFSPEEGDWHQGDKFRYKDPYGYDLEYIILTDNGTFLNDLKGHQYNAKRYRTDNTYIGDVTITDYDVMMKNNNLELIN